MVIYGTEVELICPTQILQSFSFTLLLTILLLQTQVQALDRQTVCHMVGSVVQS